MDWQAAATELINLVLTERSFPANFDWASEWPSLVKDFREAIQTDARAENASLRAELKQRDEVFAAIERLKALGAREEDITIIREAQT